LAQGRWLEAFELDEATVAEHGDNGDRRLRRAVSALDAGRPDAAAAIVDEMRALDADTPDVVLLAGRVASVRGDGAEALRCAQQVLSRDDVTVDARLSALDLEGRAFDFLGDRDAAIASW